MYASKNSRFLREKKRCSNKSLFKSSVWFLKISNQFFRLMQILMNKKISLFLFFNPPWFHRPMNMFSKLNMHLITKNKARKMYRIQNKNEQSLQNNVKMNEVKYSSYQKHFIFCVYLRLTYLSTWVLNEQHQHCWVFIHLIQIWSKLSTCFHIAMHSQIA